MEDIEAISWKNAHEDDLWVFDKLIVSRKLGYVCGPVGMDVPKPGTYIVRPCVNIPGMGRGAEFVHIEKETFHLPAGYFWCEVFQGDHISIDYTKSTNTKYGLQLLSVKGIRTSNDLWRFFKWKKVNDVLPIPSIFLPLLEKYKFINIEFIGTKAIEVHFRRNPDFVYGNSVAYPVWNDQDDSEFEFARLQGLRYVEDPSYLRKGFWID